MIKNMSLYNLKMVKRRILVVPTVNKIRIEVTWCDGIWHFPWNVKIMFIQYIHINFVKHRDTTGNNDVIWNSKFILCQNIQHIWYDIWPLIFIDTKFQILGPCAYTKQSKSDMRWTAYPYNLKMYWCSKVFIISVSFLKSSCACFLSSFCALRILTATFKSGFSWNLARKTCPNAPEPRISLFWKYSRLMQVTN